MAVIMSKQMGIPSVNKKASNYAIGESVFLNVGGVLKEFLVVNQGKPSNLYSCDNTDVFLMMKDIYTLMYYHSGSVTYPNSSVYSYLENTFYPLFGELEKSVVKQIKIPYNASAYSISVVSGNNGALVKAFIPSFAEMGISASDMPADGTVFSYFNRTSASKAAAYNGTNVAWWMRTPYVLEYGNQGYISSTGTSYNAVDAAHNSGVRPTIAISADAKFDPNTNTLIEVA